ncbi:unnamed protein product [Prorocentrum cordatum]|uniref:CN hydrolase domain-containing protein n=1 Tax=Prorocentrum cordatum TaxID=2364126 RepID=A0ABN9W4L3_9DINO|nr:unnamed protein product [Polarella glacialis]
MPSLACAAVALAGAMAVATAAGEITYKAAVAQVFQDYGVSVVEDYAQRASANGVQILVFPENGPDDAEWPYPDPDKNLCDPDDLGTVSRLACIGRTYNIYLVFQSNDVQPCNYVAPGLCWQTQTPEGGIRPSYYFDATEVIAPNGALVTKYYKHTLFQGTSNGLTQTVPELSEYFNATGVFEAFGVKFGVVICFDLTNRDLLTSYANQGITDIVFSNTWDDGDALQTMANFMAGVSFSYGFNVIGASTSLASSGSGLYSNGDILNVSFRPGCVPLILGISPPHDSSADCNDLLIGDMISPPLGASRGRRVPESVDASTENLQSALWPKVADVEDCLGIVVEPFLRMFVDGMGETSPAELFGPAASYTNPKVAELVDSAGFAGKCLRLKSPGVGIWNSTIQTADGVASCSVSAHVTRAASKESKVTYLLRTFSGKAYISGTPCPLAVSVCVLSRCLSFDGNSVQCETIDFSGISTPPENLAEFKVVQLTSSFPAGTLAFPMMASGHDLQPVAPTNLSLQGPWKASAITGATQQPTTIAAGDGALAGGTFGFISSFGASPVHWPSDCNNCFSPYSMCDSSEAFAQGPLRELMQCPPTSEQVPSCSAGDEACKYEGHGCQLECMEVEGLEECNKPCCDLFQEALEELNANGSSTPGAGPACGAAMAKVRLQCEFCFLCKPFVGPLAAAAAAAPPAGAAAAYRSTPRLYSVASGPPRPGLWPTGPAAGAAAALGAAAVLAGAALALRRRGAAAAAAGAWAREESAPITAAESSEQPRGGTRPFDALRSPASGSSSSSSSCSSSPCTEIPRFFVFSGQGSLHGLACCRSAWRPWLAWRLSGSHIGIDSRSIERSEASATNNGPHSSIVASAVADGRDRAWSEPVSGVSIGRRPTGR